MLLGSEEEPCMSTLIFVRCSKHTAHTHIRIHMYTYTYIFTSRSAKYPQPAGIKLHLLQLVLGLVFFCLLSKPQHQAQYCPGYK